ncbi:MAG: glycosyltransferase family 9 protein [Acidobacteriota bacterium]
MRLLIVRLSSMGDVIHALPLARNARRAGAAIGWVIERAFAGLLAGNTDCDAIFVADTRGWRARPLAAATLREVRNLRRRLRAFAPDGTLEVQGLWKSALIARAAGAPVIGFAAPERRESGSAIFCDVRVTPSTRARHIVERNLALLSPLGIPPLELSPDARYLGAAPHPAADEFLAAAPPGFVLFHPGAARPEKTWEESRFAALARGLLRERGLPPVISWGPGDEDRVRRLRALLPEASVAPLLDFPGLARVSAASRLFVAGDTGPLHLADALGVPTLALFGPTDPARNGPHRDKRGIVTAMHSVSEQTVLGRALERVEI